MGADGDVGILTGAGADRNMKGKPRFLVSGDHGSAGKTTFSIGMARVLRNIGHQVQTFKKGPDFIDPMWLTRASGRFCQNLDYFLMGETGILQRYARYGEGADVHLVEGNQGLFDGVDTEGANASSALARLLGMPVVLVVDCARMTRGIAPLLLGYAGFEKDLRFVGVVLNNVSGTRHEEKLKAAIERYTDMAVLGAIPRSRSLSIRERHLGLTPDGEEDAAERLVEECALAVIQGTDVDRLLLGSTSMPPRVELPHEPALTSLPTDPVRIACARDRAFSFYYPESLEALRKAGAEMEFFSPLEDPLPECEGVFLGGGFPELYAAKIAANTEFRSDLREFAARGGVVYAECGGLMTLGETLTVDGVAYEMAGVLPCRTVMTERPQGRGYMKLAALGGNEVWDIPTGSSFFAHEFHHSRLEVAIDSVAFAYRVDRGEGIGGGFDGMLHRGVLASYAHLHPASAPWWADAFVKAARTFGRRDSSETEDAALYV